MAKVTLKDQRSDLITGKGEPLTIVQAPVDLTRATEVLSTKEILATTPGRGLKALGWRFYQDPSMTDSAPVMLEAGSRTQIPIFDGGPQAQSFGAKSTKWLKTTNWRFYPDDLGDVFTYRLNMTARPTVNNKSFTVDFDIGTINRVWNDRVYLTSGAGTPVPKSFEATIACSSGMVTNGGAFYITPEADMYITRVSVLAIKCYSVTG